MAIDNFADRVTVKSGVDRIAALMFPVIEPWIPPEVDRLLQQGFPPPRHFDLLSRARMLRLELLQASRSDLSFQEVARQVWQTLCVAGALHGSPPTSSALAQARARMPLWPFKALFKHTAAIAAEAPLTAPWPAHRLLAIDGAFLTLPNQPALRSRFGVTRNQHGESYFPQALAVWISRLPQQLVLGQHIGPARQGDEVVAPYLLPQVLRQGDVVLGDAHFGHFPTLAMVASAQAFFLVRAPATLPLERFRIARIGAQESRLLLQCSPAMADKYADLSLPPTLAVRALTYTIPSRDALNTTEEACFLTNLPETYSHQALAALPPLRWSHETLNLDIKSRLGLGEVRSQTPEGVEREILAHLCLNNLIRLILLQARPAVPFTGSFTHARSALCQANEQLRCLPERREEIIRVMLQMILQQPLKPRPGRAEPRALRPRRRPYPGFTGARSDWRAKRKAG